MFYFAGVILTFFLAFVLLGKKQKSESDFVLFFWLTAIGIHLLLFYLTFSKQIFSSPHLLGIILPFPLLHGPFVYLYTSALTGNRLRWKETIAHFIPALGITLAASGFYTLSGDEKLMVYAGKGEGFGVLLFINTLLFRISGIVYVLLSLWQLRKFGKRISDEFSNTGKINLYWLRYLILGVAAVWVLVFWGDHRFLFGAAVVFVALIGYFGITQVRIFTPLHAAQPQAAANEETPKDEPQSNTPARYDKSGLTSEKAAALHIALRQIMQEKRVYENSELTLTDLAALLTVNANHLSQVINSFEKKTFYEYINELRIHRFTQVMALPENKNKTILAIAFECGFNSKSSFNKHFKRIHGTTPSGYLQAND
jgi:AraC-like DNA-binding protein